MCMFPEQSDQLVRPVRNRIVNYADVDTALVVHFSTVLLFCCYDVMMTRDKCNGAKEVPIVCSIDRNALPFGSNANPCIRCEGGIRLD